jgi:hypothetical protein
MEIIKSANLAARFLLELCMLAALGYSGVHIGRSLVAKIVLGIGVPLVAVVVWSLYLAPASSLRVHGTLYLGLQVVIFGLAASALYAVGRSTLAGALLLAVMLNGALMYVWQQ